MVENLTSCCPTRGNLKLEPQFPNLLKPMLWISQYKVSIFPAASIGGIIVKNRCHRLKIVLEVILMLLLL